MLFGFNYYSVEKGEYFRHGHGVDFAERIVAFFDELLEMAASDLCRELIGDDFAGAFLLLDPSSARQGDPHGAAVYVEANVDSVGVARGDGHDGAFPAAVQILAGPAVGDVKILVHVLSLSFRGRRGKVDDAYTDGQSMESHMSVEFLGSLQLASGAMSGGVDPHEILQYFSWWAYLAIAAGYTAFVFLSGYIDKFLGFGRHSQHGRGSIPNGSPDSAGKIVGPISRVMKIHGGFLLGLLCGLRIVGVALPYLPEWLTNNFVEGKNGHSSVIDYLCLIAVAALAFVERKRLCSKPRTP